MFQLQQESTLCYLVLVADPSELDANRTEGAKIIFQTIFYFIPQHLREKNAFSAVTLEIQTIDVNLGTCKQPAHKTYLPDVFLSFNFLQKPTASTMQTCYTTVARRSWTARLEMLAEDACELTQLTQNYD